MSCFFSFTEHAVHAVAAFFFQQQKPKAFIMVFFFFLSERNMLLSFLTYKHFYSNTNIVMFGIVKMKTIVTKLVKKINK